MNLFKLLAGLFLLLIVQCNLKKSNSARKLYEFTEYVQAKQVTDFINSEYCTNDYTRTQSHDYFVGALPLLKKK